MHAFHQPLPVLEEMDVEEVMGWSKDAQALLKALHGTRVCPFMK